MQIGVGTDSTLKSLDYVFYIGNSAICTDSKALQASFKVCSAYGPTAKPGKTSRQQKLQSTKETSLKLSRRRPGRNTLNYKTANGKGTHYHCSYDLDLGFF